MDFETEMLDAHDMAEADRFLKNRIKTIEPEGVMSGGVPTMTDAERAEQLKTVGTDAVKSIGRIIGNAATSLGQQAANIGSDLLQDTANQMIAPTLQTTEGEDIKLKAPIFDVPQVETANGFEALMSDIVQFGMGMAIAPGSLYVRGGASAFAFDPVEADLAGALNEMGVLPAALEFLTSTPEEMETAEGRMKQRMMNVLQETAIAGSVDGIIRVVKNVKNTPEVMDRFTTAIQNKFVEAGQAADVRIAERAADTSVTLGSGVDPTPAIDASLSYIGKLLNQNETSVITKDANKIAISKVRKAGFETKEQAAAAAQTEADRIIALYPESEGWLRPEVQTQSTKPSFSLNDEGKIKIRWKEPAYAFHIPPEGKDIAQHTTDLTNSLVSDVKVVLDRAKNGDQAAVDIIKQASWYRSMRTRLRKEFGGLADVFADILGATSANTAVQQNYDNALIALRKFVRGDYDEAIELYAELVEAGETVSPAILNARNADENDPFFLIAKDSGKVFGTNSPSATAAMLDMFRQVKMGSSPKTKNFTGNLIGFGTDATIDVWAARYLRDVAGLPRIAPPSEKAVAGKHLSGSTLENPKIGSEFGFGQKVFDAAAKLLNDAGEIKDAYPDVGDLGADDLQAVVWFMEKEKWTNKGWTSKSGEGGSLDFESDFGGSPDRPRVAELRSIINSINSKPEDIEAAQAELATLAGEPQRFVAGVSRERPDQLPTNTEQADLAAELTAPLKNDAKVIAYQANNTYGEFMGDAERALNFEVTTQTDFDSAEMTKALVNAGRKYDQDAVFISKVVPDGTSGARPGVEVYFRERQGANYAQQITAILRDKGIDGFTFITDARMKDRADIQSFTSEDIAGLVGIRFQYIPEFDDAFDPANADDIFREKAKAFQDVMDEVGTIDGITYADVVFYDTQVFKNTDRKGAEWINGGTSYEQHIGSASGRRFSEGQNGGQLLSEAAAKANSR